MEKYVHVPEKDRNGKEFCYDGLCDCADPPEDGDVLRVAPECGCHGDEEGLGKHVEGKGTFSCLIVHHEILSIQYYY